MRELVDGLLTELAAGAPFSLVTLVDEQGSTPRTRGTSMVVRQDGSIRGTIGGGLLEATMMREAAGVLARRRSRVVEMDFGGRKVDEPAMLCGGRATVLVAYVSPHLPGLGAALASAADAVGCGLRARLVTACSPTPGDTEVSFWVWRDDGQVAGDLAPSTIVPWTEMSGASGIWTVLPDGRGALLECVEPPPLLLVCGAGHVAQALTPVAAGVGFRVIVLDDRPEFADAQRFPAAAEVRVVSGFEGAFTGLTIDKRSLIVIVTRGHEHDLTALVQALRTSAGYVGLMASRTKREKMLAALRERGFSGSDLERIHSPIGLAIGAETPAELAISIVAELVQARAGRLPEGVRAPGS